MKKLITSLTLMLCVTLVGCDKGAENMSAAVPEPAAATPAADGETLYSSNCAQCHEGQISKAPHFSLLEQMTPRAIFAALQTGLMRNQAQALSPADRQAVAEYISGTPMSDEVNAPACVAGSSPFDYSAPPDVDGWGMNDRNQRYLPWSVTGIDRANVSKLRLKWAFAYPDAIKARSQAVIAGGALFVGSHDGTVFSLDRRSGCVRWTFKARGEVRTGIIAEKWRAGDTNARPKLFFGDVIGNVYAVDAVTGALVWRDRPDDHPSLTITAAPTFHEGRLYVPMSSLEVTAAANPKYACCTFRGGVAAYDAASGEKLWVAHTIAKEPKIVGRNSIGTPQIAPSGAPVWASVTLDTKRRRLYVGSGENYSSPANGSSDAIIAFDMDGGKIVWIMQATASDAWNMGCEAENRTNCPSEDGPDYDFGSPPILATTSAGKDIILAGQKSGRVFGLDPDDGGRIIWQKKLGRGGIQGGVHFGMAVDGDVLYAPMSDFKGGPRWPGEAKAGMFALNIADGAVLWYSPAPNPCKGRQYCDPGISAAATAIPGAVLAGSMDGYLRAYDKKTGAIVWAFDTARNFKTLSGETAHGGSIGGGVGPVFKDGMMYVSSGYGVYGHMPGNLLLAFSVDGN